MHEDLSSEISQYQGKKRKISTLYLILSGSLRVRKRLEGRGRIVVRYSGTESLLRIMAEGEKKKRSFR